ncbi:MAG: LysM peptidoglycan-binding domain-containing protein [Bacteroidota bacterium]|nr:LysM peptidoglycan-binding domain-containing protein [Bacteroidota bacterium]
MLKWTLIFSLLFFVSSFSFAQQNNIEIKGTAAKYYIEHTIAPKENFYSVGRMYNIPAKDIAAYNNLQFENSLSIGQTIKIPLTENNFAQTTTAKTGEIFVPVYHSVEPKEGLYRVSVNYNKVPLDVLKKWNHLQSDEVSAGQSLIIGYLKVDKNESPLASTGISQGTAKSSVTKTDPKPENVKPAITPDRLPPVKNPDVQKEETASNTTQQPAQPPAEKVTTVKTRSTVNFAGGYFKKLYEDQANQKPPVNEAGSAGVFKSTSGWQDGKYYCFNNDALPGTIIKITDNATGKSVFAKVLDIIPEIKQNEGLSVIVSNSAAEELGTGENKFDCALTFVK